MVEEEAVEVRTRVRAEEEAAAVRNTRAWAVEVVEAEEAEVHNRVLAAAEEAVAAGDSNRGRGDDACRGQEICL